MTSNVGSEHIAKMSSLGFLREGEEIERESLKDKVMEALKQDFRPEFLNRIDEIVIFNYLGKKEIRKIVDLEIRKVTERLIARKIKIRISEKAKEFLAEQGFDPNLGARPLKRVIQKKVLDPLALKIVSGAVRPGDEVTIDAESDKIIIRTPADLSSIRIKKLNPVVSK